MERRQETIPWETTGDRLKMVDLRWDGFEWGEDDQVDEERCGFWQRASYAPPWNSST